MSDYIDIKAINEQLIWNKPIVELIDSTCFNIDYLTNKIEVFVSRGELVDGIEFFKAEIGTYRIEEIDNSFFNQITFELITPTENVRKIIQTLFDKTIKINLFQNRLTLTYVGNNSKDHSNRKLIEKHPIDLNEVDNWNLDIRNLRDILKSEYCYYSYDYNYSTFYNYGWLEFKDIEIKNLKGYNFRAYFNYSDNVITHIETIIGNEISDYEKVKSHFVEILGQPRINDKENTELQFNHHFKNDIWLTDKFEIEIHSAYIARSEPEQFRYELEIRNTVPNA